MQIDVEINNGWDIPSHPTNTIKRMIYMLATLQFIVRFVLILSTIIGLVFIEACTIFVIACVIHGDIKIDITKIESENE